MNNIFSQAGREALEQFARSNVLLAFDYDGTLAPIVAEPDRAVMRPSTRQLLEALTRIYPVVVISGRAQRDALKRLRGTGLRAIVGNHGAEPWNCGEVSLNETERWRSEIEKDLIDLAGVHIEDKSLSIAVHYRQARDKRKAREAIIAAAEKLEDVRIIGGKQVVNILSRRAPNKGVALLRERDCLHCDTAIYVGDDETDEDVFVLDEPGRLLTIRVGAKRGSAASYFLVRQPGVDDLIKEMIDLRLAQRGRVAK